MRNLSFRFTGRPQLLRDINLIVREGNITALIGESGCGKSTILQILERFYHAETGYNIINGKFDIRDVPIEVWRNTISTVPQEVKLFNCTIIENICLSDKKEDFSVVIELCNEYKLSDYFNQFPQGLLTKVGEDGLSLSGGQKQIVALARALFSKPKFLLLDEPTAALDFKTENFILALLSELKKKNIGILLITHKDTTLKIADLIYEIKGGYSIQKK